MSLAYLKRNATLIVITLSALLTFSSAEAGVDYHWHRQHHYHSDFGPGVLFGTALGFLVGAAVTNSGPRYNDPNYYYHYRSCRQVTVNCYVHQGYYGSYRNCYRTVRWVC